MKEAKYKAEELINRFISVGCLFANAKQCALICVDEILSTYMTKDLIYPSEFKFWNEVKQEILNRQ